LHWREAIQILESTRRDNQVERLLVDSRKRKIDNRVAPDLVSLRGSDDGQQRILVPSRHPPHRLLLVLLFAVSPLYPQLSSSHAAHHLHLVLPLLFSSSSSSASLSSYSYPLLSPYHLIQLSYVR